MKNYRAVSFLSTVPKIFEQLMQKQISKTVLTSLCLLLSVLHKRGFSSQGALVRLTKTWKHQLHENGFAGVTLMDLSKGFHTINCDS